MRNLYKVKKDLLIFGLIFALFSIYNYYMFNGQVGPIEIRDEGNSKSPKKSASYSESFIHVNGNWSTTVSSYAWCSGDGSWNNPYTIENVTIDASNSPTGSGIFIQNSQNDYFMIKNCNISGSAVYEAGIKLKDTNNGFLINNNCSNNSDGIQFWFCDNNTISGNIANNNDIGIYFDHSCNNNKISENMVNYNIFGIKFVEECNGNTLNGNIAINNSYSGIYLSEGYNNTLTGNIAINNTNNGIELSFCYKTSLTNNKVEINNRGIGLQYCNRNTLTGNIIKTSSFSGIVLSNSDNNTLTGNTANDSNEFGIYLYTSNNNLISGNTANNNGWNGIYIFDNCTNNIISGNTVKDNSKEGISISSCNKTNIITENTLSENYIGIYLDANKTIISENIVNNNYFYGILLLSECYYNTISENLVYEHSNYGINIDSNCNNNLLFQNCILNSTAANARDVSSNDWNNTLIGNYWSDYSGLDADSDGIGDTPYDISGGAGNKDYKPIMNDVPYLFNPPSDLTYEVETTGNKIKWIVLTLTQRPFKVFRDGTIIKTGKTSIVVNEIEINVDSLTLGKYCFSIEIDDGYGGIILDDMWVFVVNTPPVFTYIPKDLSYEVGEVGNRLSWTFSDISTNNPVYTIERNNLPLIIDEFCISGEPIEFFIENLTIGQYCFTIEINDGYGGTARDVVWVLVMERTKASIYVKIIQQSFSQEEFIITFWIYNKAEQGIDTLSIQMWWNDVDVTDNITNLGNGMHSVSLVPITVASGEESILLRMLISANGYEDKYFETYFAVDPEIINKYLQRASVLPFIIAIAIISSIAAGIGVAGVTLFIKRRRKEILDKT